MEGGAGSSVRQTLQVSSSLLRKQDMFLLHQRIILICYSRKESSLRLIEKNTNSELSVLNPLPPLSPAPGEVFSSDLNISTLIVVYC